MSEEQLKAFIAKAKDDQSIQERLKAAKTPDAVVAIAKAAGFVISADDLMKAQSKLSEKELEGVAGGGDAGVAASGLLSMLSPGCGWQCELIDKVGK